MCRILDIPGCWISQDIHVNLVMKTYKLSTLVCTCLNIWFEWNDSFLNWDACHFYRIVTYTQNIFGEEINFKTVQFVTSSMYYLSCLKMFTYNWLLKEDINIWRIIQIYIQQLKICVLLQISIQKNNFSGTVGIESIITI